MRAPPLDGWKTPHTTVQGLLYLAQQYSGSCPSGAAMLAGNPERQLALNSQARPHDVHFSRNETWREAVTLEQFANIAEIVAAIAVLATLVYLVIQLRQAKEQIALIHHHHKVDAGLQLMSSLSDSQHLARIFAELGDRGQHLR